MYQVAIACVLLFILFTALHVIIRTRRLVRPKATPPSPAFDLVELQALLDSGKITTAEYDRLRAALTKQAAAEPIQGAGGFEVLPAQTNHSTAGRDESLPPNP